MNNKSIPGLSLRKILLSALVAAPVATLPAPLWAYTEAGVNGEIVSTTPGVTIVVAPTTLNITSTATNSVINWKHFGDGAATVNDGETVNFLQPGATAAVLNYVTGATVTNIAGSITSNGSVYVLNKNGITVTGNAVITTAGLGLSAVNEPLAEYNFATAGNLGYVGAAAGNVSVAETAKINVGTSGVVTLAGNLVTVAGNITGSTLNVRTVAAGAANLATAGNLTVNGNLNVVTNGGAITVGNASTSAVTVNGSTVTLNTSGGDDGGAISGTGLTVSTGTAAAAANLTLNSIGAKTNGEVNLTTVKSGSNKPLTITLNTGNATLSGSGNMTLNASTVNGNLSVTTSSGSIASGGVVTVTGTASTISLSASADVAYSGAGNVTLASLVSGATGTVSLTAAGSLTIPTITAKNATLTAGTDVTQTGTLTLTGTLTTDAGNSSVLSNGDNAIATLVVKRNAGGAAITSNRSGGLTLAKGTDAAGNVSITTRDLNLGAASGDTISIAGAFSVNTAPWNGSVSQKTDNMTVTGASTYTLGTGSLVLTGSTGRGIALNNRYGQINATAGNVVVFEADTLNLGTITSDTLVAYSTANITNSGKLTIGTSTIVGAGTAAAPGAIDLGYLAGNATTANAIGGNVYIMNDLALISGNASVVPTGSTIGNYLASSFALHNNASFTFNLPANVYGTASGMPISLTNIGANSITTTALNTTGAVSLASGTGSITTNASADNAFSTVNVTSAGGAVSISTPKDLTVNATLTTAAANNARFESTAGNVRIGSITSAYDAGSVSFVAAASKTVTDTVAGIFIYGPVVFNGPGGVSVTQAGHNFGGVSISTTDSAASLVEGGTLRIVNVSTGKGAVSLTSSNGNIIETGGGTVTSSGLSTFRAENGLVTLGTTANAMTGGIALTAKNSSTITQGGSKAVKLGNIVVSAGNLTVDATGSGADLVQVKDATLNVFGASSFTNDGSNKITLTNSGNRLGALTLATGTGAIAVTELTTMNLRSISTTGTLTATSEAGDIIDSGTTGFAIGAASFKAANVTLALPTNYTTVSFNTTGNVSIIDNAGSLDLGASTVGGTFMAQTLDALTQSGTLNIAGATTLIASNNSSSITLADFTNRFGAVRFTVGNGGATFSEATSFNLRGGSVATGGTVAITTGGDFLTSGTGGSSINGSLTINAVGTIIPSAGSLLVTGTFTVNSANLKDLSALSLAGNLLNHAPVDQGTGEYRAPSNP